MRPRRATPPGHLWRTPPEGGGVGPSATPQQAALLLVDRLEWMRAHDPDADALDTVAIPTETFVVDLRRELQGLARRDERVTLVGARRVRVRVVDGGPSFAQVFVDTTAGTRVVTHGGGVVRREPVAAAHWEYIVTHWMHGRWYLAGVIELNPEYEPGATVP